jgi:hypothetical protein
MPEPWITVVLDCADGDAILGMGASMVDEKERCLGDHCWYVMADPEGNEFCVAPD